MKLSSISYFLSSFLLAIALLFFIISPVYTDETQSTSTGRGLVLKHVSSECFKEGNCTLSDFLLVFKGLADLMLSVLGAIALLFFIIGGVIWLTSGGSSGQIEKGKKILSGTVIGIIIVLGAWTLVNFIIVGLMPKGARETFFGTGESPWWKIPGAQKPASTEKKVVGRGEMCNENINCQSGLSCRSHIESGWKKVCVELASREEGRDCIPIEGGESECGVGSCQDQAHGSPNDCHTKIECGKCAKVARGKRCNTDEDCETNLSCREHFVQKTKKVCVELNSRGEGEDCIPIGPKGSTEAECRGGKECNDAALPPGGDCNKVIICGGCK